MRAIVPGPGGKFGQTWKPFCGDLNAKDKAVRNLGFAKPEPALRAHDPDCAILGINGHRAADVLWLLLRLLRS